MIPFENYHSGNTFGGAALTADLTESADDRQLFAVGPFDSWRGRPDPETAEKAPAQSNTVAFFPTASPVI